MDAGDKFTALFWIVVLAIAGCCAYDDETSSSSDNFEYEEVEVETVVIDEVVECDAPVVTEEMSELDAALDFRCRGSVKELDGRICVVKYFLSYPDDLWTELERDVVTERVFEAEVWLKREAAKFGKEVVFTNCSIGNSGKCYTLDYIPTDSDDDDNDDNLFQKAMRGIKWNDHDAFIERMKEEYDCESVLVMLMVKATGRSWAYPYSRNYTNKGKTQQALESAVIFKDKRYKDGTVAPLKATTVAHEILHLCGAWDLYYEEGIQDHEHADKAEELFPNSIVSIRQTPSCECLRFYVY